VVDRQARRLIAGLVTRRGVDVGEADLSYADAKRESGALR
jgi:hypothetical protein